MRFVGEGVPSSGEKALFSPMKESTGEMARRRIDRRAGDSTKGLKDYWIFGALRKLISQAEYMMLDYLIGVAIILSGS